MYQKSTLANGLRIVTETMPHTRSIAVSIFIGVGSRFEADPQAGISHFIEHMLFKGTSRRPASRDISEAIEGIGGLINGGTDKEVTVYWSKVAQHHFPTALDVLGDMLLNSNFDAKELERERNVIIEEIHMNLDVPAQRADMLIDELLFDQHPLGREIAGSKETVSSITRDMMLSYLGSQYRPTNAVVAVAGNIEHEPAVSLVERCMGGWSSSLVEHQYVPYRQPTAPRVRVERRETEQVHLCLGLPGVSLLDPRRFTLDVLNVVLGEGMSSRLFTEIRDRLGLAYSVASFADHYSDSGSLTVYAGVEPAKVRPAITEIINQLFRFNETVPETELTKAKELSKGRLMLRMEDSRAVAGWLGGQEILAGRIYTPDDMLAIIDSVTTEAIRNLAEEIIDERKLCLAAVGPVDQKETLESLLRSP